MAEYVQLNGDHSMVSILTNFTSETEKIEVTDTEKVTILWVFDEVLGTPNSGLAKYKEEKVWFFKIRPEGIYQLLRLSPELLSLVEENHQDYCLVTGSPLFHGDPAVIKRKAIMTKSDFTLEKITEAYPRSMANVIKYEHKHDPYPTGEHVSYVSEANFTNFRVPHRIIAN